MTSEDPNINTDVSIDADNKANGADTANQSANKNELAIKDNNTDIDKTGVDNTGTDKANIEPAFGDTVIEPTAAGNAIEQAEDSPQPQTILIVHASVGSGHKTAALAVEQAFNLINEAVVSQEEHAAAQNNSEQSKRGQSESAQNDGVRNGGTQDNSTQDNSAQDNSTQDNSTQDNSTQDNSAQDNGTPKPTAPYKVEVLDILDFGRHRFNGDNTASMFTGATRPFYDLTWRYTLTGRLLWGGGTIWAHVMFPKFVEYVQEVNPAAIICTHITAANVAVSARMLTGQLFPIVCVPTDYEIEGLWPHQSTDLFCVADERMAETLRPRKVPPSRIQVTGIPANPAFSIEYDKQVEREKFGFPDDKHVVLFLAGASLPRPYVHFRNAIHELLPYVRSLENMHMVIVCGKDSEYEQELKREISDLKLDNVDVFGYVNEMAALMSAADLIVCKSGGLTVTECLCAGTPMILVGRAYGQEKSNVTMLTSTGAAYHVTTWRELNELLHSIEKHPQMTDGILVNASLIRKPHAAMDIARATIRLINAERDILSTIYKKHFMHFYIGGSPAHIR